MLGRRILCVGLGFAILTTGCESMNNTEKGAGAGGLIGAGTGALIGNAVGHTGAGAAIGAGIGAISGALVGNSVDESERKTEARIAAATAVPATQLSMVEVAQLAQSHVSDAVIVSQIRSTRSVYHLSATDTIWLKEQGVSDYVVKEMLTTASRYPQRVYTARPVYGEPTYVIERPAPVIYTTAY